MNLLTKAKQQDMANQMCNKARDIDICLYNALDGTMPKGFLLDCLMLYEAKDGGFAHGLYIDNYNTNSSVYQVYEALRMLDMLDFDASYDDPEHNQLFDHITSKCFNYLYNRAELKDGIWNPNVKTNDDFAHAERFSYTDENVKLFGYHPTAAIIGYTLTLCKPSKAYYKKALRMLDDALNYLYNHDLNKYEAISFASLYNSLKKANLKSEEYNKIEEKLISNALNNVSLNFEDVNALHPLEAALYLNDEKLNEMKNQELDYLIDSIKSFGLWDHKTTWGWDKYPEEDSANLKWIGAETANNYFLLKKCGRVE
ncbi:MAG: hypothetical protein K6A63_01490 [Acholeplasmatales bacterium]|nr:hypothetical protein [Acholeplasmatales bacterium]